MSISFIIFTIDWFLLDEVGNIKQVILPTFRKQGKKSKKQIRVG